MSSFTTEGTYQPTVVENPNGAQPPPGQNGPFGRGHIVWGHPPRVIVANSNEASEAARDIYQHISCMPQYLSYSPEELRLRDYKNHRILSRLHCGLLLATYRGTTLRPAPPVHVPRTYTRYGASVVTFEVGKGSESKSFAIHESLISHRSEFVRLALRNDWKEARERKIPLPDDDPDIFETYQIFLYDRDIYKTDGLEQFRRLVQAYLLGEKLVDVGFKNSIIDAIIIKLRNTSSFDPRLTNLIYENTPDTSPLRRLLRDIYVWTGSARWFDERDLDEPINADFMRDVNEEQFRARQPWKDGVPPLPPFLDGSHGWDVYHEVRVGGDDDPKHLRKSLTPKGWKIQPW